MRTILRRKTNEATEEQNKKEDEEKTANQKKKKKERKARESSVPLYENARKPTDTRNNKRDEKTRRETSNLFAVSFGAAGDDLGTKGEETETYLIV